MNFLKEKFKVWWLQVFLIFITSGFVSLVYFYFVKQKVSFGLIFFTDFCGYILIVAYLMFRRKLNFRKNICLGFILIILAMLSLLLPFASTIIIFPYAILNSLGIIIFFCSYNILYFKQVNKGNLQHMTFYWAIMILVGVVAPLVGSVILSTFKLPIFILTAVGVLFLAIYSTNNIENGVYEYSLSDLFGHMKGLRTIMIVDGALYKVSFIIVTIFSLRYLKTEINFGLFLSVAALIGLFVTFPVAKISDRKNKRTFLIWSLSLLSGFLVLSFVWINTFWLYMILAFSLKAVSSIIDPIRANVVLDKAEAKNPISWLSREVCLNIGRVFLSGITAILVSYNYFNAIFVFLAILYFIYPLLIHYKKVYYAPIN